MRGSGGWGHLVRTPLEIRKSIRFYCITDQDSLANKKATKPTFKVGPLSARKRTPLKWRFARWSMLVHFKWYLDASLPSTTTTKRRCQSVRDELNLL